MLWAEAGGGASQHGKTSNHQENQKNTFEKKHLTPPGDGTDGVHRPLLGGDRPLGDLTVHIRLEFRLLGLRDRHSLFAPAQEAETGTAPLLLLTPEFQPGRLTLQENLPGLFKGRTPEYAENAEQQIHRYGQPGDAREEKGHADPSQR